MQCFLVSFVAQGSCPALQSASKVQPKLFGRAVAVSAAVVVVTTLTGGDVDAVGANVAVVDAVWAVDDGVVGLAVAEAIVAPVVNAVLWW